MAYKFRKILFLIICYCTSFVPVVTLASENPDDREYVDWADYPNVIRLSGAGTCTGQYVAPNLILTAAHCSRYLGKNIENFDNLNEKETFLIYDYKSGRHYAFKAKKVAYGKNYKQSNWLGVDDWMFLLVEDPKYYSKTGFYDMYDIQGNEDYIPVEHVGFGGMRKLTDTDVEELRRIYSAYNNRPISAALMNELEKQVKKSIQPDLSDDSLNLKKSTGNVIYNLNCADICGKKKNKADPGKCKSICRSMNVITVYKNKLWHKHWPNALVNTLYTVGGDSGGLFVTSDKRLIGIVSGGTAVPLYDAEEQARHYEILTSNIQFKQVLAELKEKYPADMSLVCSEQEIAKMPGTVRAMKKDGRCVVTSEDDCVEIDFGYMFDEKEGICKKNTCVKGFLEKEHAIDGIMMYTGKGEYESFECILEKCMDGYFLTKDNKCVELANISSNDDLLNGCNASELEALGASLGEKHNGSCIVLKCKNDFTGIKGRCISNAILTADEPELEECTASELDRLHAIAGTKQNGKCVALVCNDLNNYTLLRGECIDNNVLLAEEDVIQECDVSELRRLNAWGGEKRDGKCIITVCKDGYRLAGNRCIMIGNLEKLPSLKIDDVLNSGSAGTPHIESYHAAKEWRMTNPDDLRAWADANGVDYEQFISDTKQGLDEFLDGLVKKYETLNFGDLSLEDLAALTSDLTVLHSYNEQIETLEKLYKEAKERETSLENRMLGGLTMAATGIGGMMLASGLAEQSADEAAERDMRAYLATFQCKVGDKRYPGGTNAIETPGANQLINLYTQYAELASDLKERKAALGMKAGIESEVVIDKATTGLYDDVGVGLKSGAYASIARALQDPNGEDAAKWAQQIEDSKSKTKTGGIVGGVGAAGGAIGNIIINGGDSGSNSSSGDGLMDGISSALGNVDTGTAMKVLQNMKK